MEFILLSTVGVKSSQPFPRPPFPGQLFQSSCYKKVSLSTPVEGDCAFLTICLLLSQLPRGARTMNLCCGQCLPCDELPGAESSRKSHFLFLQRAVIVSSINVCCTRGRENTVSSCMAMKLSSEGNLPILNGPEYLVLFCNKKLDTSIKNPLKFPYPFQKEGSDRMGSH